MNISTLLRNRWFLLAVFLWVIRAIITLAGADPYLSDDTRWHYIPMAENLLAGHGYSISKEAPFLSTALRVPGYAFYLIFFYCPWPDSPLVTVAFHLVWEICAIVILYRTFLFLTQNHVGARAIVFLYLLWPYCLRVNGQIIREPIFIPIFVTAACLFLWSVQRDCLKILFYCAVTLVASMYIREDGLYYLMFFTFAWAALHWRNWKKGLKGCALLVVVGALGLSPWIIRNALTFGKFIPLANISHSLLWSQHNVDYKKVHPPEPLRLPLIEESHRSVFLEAEKNISLALENRATPEEFETSYQDLSSLNEKYLQAYPLQYLSFLPKRFIRYVLSSRIDFLPGRPTNWWIKNASSIFHGLCYLIGIAGFLLSWRHAYLIVFVLFPALSVSLIGVLTGRYELHIFPLLFLGCGFFLDWLQRQGICCWKNPTVESS